MLVVAAFAVAVAGLLPRLSMLAWVLVVAVLFQATLGETLRLPNAVDAISPFWHLAGVPQEPSNLFPASSSARFAVALVTVGLWGYRRRDLTSN